MTKREYVSISKVYPNDGQIEGLPKNPRLIKGERFRKLCKSIKELPEMTEARDILVYPYNGGYIVIGGNMRLHAYRHLGWKEGAMLYFTGRYASRKASSNAYSRQ